jgi:hypothetical protein
MSSPFTASPNRGERDDRTQSSNYDNRHDTYDDEQFETFEAFLLGEELGDYNGGLEGQKYYVFRVY